MKLLNLPEVSSNAAGKFIEDRVALRTLVASFSLPVSRATTSFLRAA